MEPLHRGNGSLSRQEAVFKQRPSSRPVTLGVGNRQESGPGWAAETHHRIEQTVGLTGTLLHVGS